MSFLLVVRKHPRLASTWRGVDSTAVASSGKATSRVITWATHVFDSRVAFLFRADSDMVAYPGQRVARSARWPGCVPGCDPCRRPGSPPCRLGPRHASYLLACQKVSRASVRAEGPGRQDRRLGGFFSRFSCWSSRGLAVPEIRSEPSFGPGLASRMLLPPSRTCSGRLSEIMRTCSRVADLPNRKSKCPRACLSGPHCFSRGPGVPGSQACPGNILLRPRT